MLEGSETQTCSAAGYVKEGSRRCLGAFNFCQLRHAKVSLDFGILVVGGNSVTPKL